MRTCPKCHQITRQNRSGKTESGAQSYLCMHCRCKYTPEPKPRGYPEDMRQQALRIYLDRMNLRRIRRHLGIHNRTVSLWVKAHAASLPEAPMPEEVKAAELDELFTFIGHKKTGSSSSHA